MDFSLSEEQREICRAVKELSRKGLNQNVFEDDDQANFPKHKWDLCRSFGIQGLPIPEAYGGHGQSMLTTALAIESLAASCHDEGLIFSICAHLCMCSIPILRFGSEAQKRDYLRDVASGERIGGNAISEPNAGSDLANMGTSVRQEQSRDGYLLNGTKMFVTNAPVADLLIVYARHPGGMKMLDISAFIVEKDNPGLEIGQIFKTMGLRTSTISEVVLSDCLVPREALLFREKRGMMVFNESMFWERVIMSAYHLGAMSQQYDQAMEYANQREQFGQRIIEYSRVADKLIALRMHLETLRLLLYKICWHYDTEQKMSMSEASMLKLMVSEARVQSSLDVLQIFGAYGYMKESHAEKQLRDAIAGKIYSGTSEIQKKIIADGLGKKNG